MSQNKLINKNGNTRVLYDHVYYQVLKELEQIFGNSLCETELRKKYPGLNFVISESLWSCIKAALALVHHGKEACFQQALDYNPRWILEPEELARELSVCVIEALAKYKTCKIDNVEEMANPLNLENNTKKFIVFLAKSFKSVLITNNQGVKEVMRYVTYSDQTLQAMSEREFHAKKKKIKHKIVEVVSKRVCIYFSEVNNLYKSNLKKQGNRELTDNEIVESMIDKFTYHCFTGGYVAYLSDPEIYTMLKEEIESKEI